MRTPAIPEAPLTTAEGDGRTARSSPTDGRYSPTMENKVLTCAPTWKAAENIELRERSQIQDTRHTTPRM